MILVVMLVGLGMLGSCDSGQKAVDEVTGNRAVKQYHKSKKDIENIAEQQADRNSRIPDDEKEDNE